MYLLEIVKIKMSIAKLERGPSRWEQSENVKLINEINENFKSKARKLKLIYFPQDFKLII